MKLAWIYAGILCLATAVESGAAAPKPVPVPPVTASDPNSVMLGLTAAGYTPTLTKDGQGDPSITFSDGTGQYRVWFQNCEVHLKCKVIQLYCEWGGASLVTPQKLNDEWISVFTTPLFLYVNKTNQRLTGSSFLMTDPGGISRELFATFAKRWVADVQIAGAKFATASK